MIFGRFASHVIVIAALGLFVGASPATTSTASSIVTRNYALADYATSIHEPTTVNQLTDAPTIVKVVPWHPETGSAYLADGNSVSPGEERLSRLAADGSTYAGVTSAGNYIAGKGVFLIVTVSGPNGIVEMTPDVTVTIDQNDPLMDAKIKAAYALASDQGFISIQRGDLVDGRFTLR